MSANDEDPQELQINSALMEYLHTCDKGESPDREEFLSRHHELRDQLTELLMAVDWIEQLAGPTADSVDPSPPQPPEYSQNNETLPISVQPPIDIVTGSDATLPQATPTGHEFSIGPKPLANLAQIILPCRFGEYILQKLLGRGGMGVVYSGHQVNLDREVAVKMIRSGALASPEEVQRFYAEARSAAKLDHPNIVTVYQCGECDNHHYFSMDYIRGSDLAKLMHQGPMEGKRAARYVRDVARAIQYAHDQGILHRDLKPANVLVDEHDQVHVTDFGLAKSIGHETGLTATGAALGTPSYMSPEQAAGRSDEHDSRTDVYSLGAVLFALVTGKPPFQGTSVVQTIMHVIHRPAPMAREVLPTVDKNIETVIDKCLQKTLDDRYATAGDLADDLDRYLRGEPIHARPASTVQQMLNWSMGIPVVAAIVGDRVVEPTRLHRWVQRWLITAVGCAAVALITAVLPVDAWMAERLPRTINIAAGMVGGSYDVIAKHISDDLHTRTGKNAIAHSTEGSVDNAQRLLNGDVDLALLQASTVRSSRIAVIAPLYYEAVHVIARNPGPIYSITDLISRRVALGPPGSGSHSVATMLLTRHGIPLADIHAQSIEWTSLDRSPEIDAAVVVVQVGNRLVHEKLMTGKYRLIPIPKTVELSLDEPVFHPLVISNVHYPGIQLPEGGLTSIATTAFLAARQDAPNALVRAVLETLYKPEMVAKCGILSAEKAANWQGLAWHSAASKFFEPIRMRKP